MLAYGSEWVCKGAIGHNALAAIAKGLTYPIVSEKDEEYVRGDTIPK